MLFTTPPVHRAITYLMPSQWVVKGFITLDHTNYYATVRARGGGGVAVHPCVLYARFLMGKTSGSHSRNFRELSQPFCPCLWRSSPLPSNVNGSCFSLACAKAFFLNQDR